MARVVTGQVVSDKAAKTITVRVDRRVSHPIYKKQYTISNKFAAHDEKQEANVGDLVEITETRPISKSKTWNLVKVVEKAKVLGTAASEETK